MSEDVHLVVTDEKLYRGTGLVHRWLIGLGNSMYHNVVRYAPERTGVLRAGIFLDFEQHEATLRVLSTVVGSSAPYTKYVIGGTAENGAGYIYRKNVDRGLVDRLANLPRNQMFKIAKSEGLSTKGLWMKIDDGGPKFHLRVHGQRANNFLLKGYDATARTHRALHPIFPGIIT